MKRPTPPNNGRPLSTESGSTRLTNNNHKPNKPRSDKENGK